MSEKKCATCGASFINCHQRGSDAPGVSEVLILACENGHSGKQFFGPAGRLQQTMGVSNTERENGGKGDT